MRTSVKTLAAGTLAAATFLIAPAAIADNSTATVDVAAGALSVTASDPANLSVTTGNTAGTATGTMAVTVDDATGTNDGWVIHQSISEDNFTNAETGGTIPASSLTMTEVTLVTKGAGLDMTTPDVHAAALTRGTSINLGTGGNVLTAAAEQGEGEYTATMGLSLNVPAYSSAGSYTATLVSTSSTPVPQDV